MWTVLTVNRKPQEEPEFLADDPSPEEIKAECLRIQTSWTEAERRYRAGCRRDVEMQQTRLQFQ